MPILLVGKFVVDITDEEDLDLTTLEQKSNEEIGKDALADCLGVPRNQLVSYEVRIYETQE